MNIKSLALTAALTGLGLFLGSGCDWSSNGPSLNTSQGAGININFSGVYYGNINGRAVDRTSAGTISHLTIRQSGNRVEVIDSQGSRYEGTVGAPGLVARPRGDGRFPPGAELVQAQISWRGKDGVAQKDVEFVGIIHAVAVEDVQSKTESRIITDESQSERSREDVQETTETRTENNGQTTTITEITTVGTPTSPFYQQTVIVTVIDNRTGRVLSRNVRTTGNSSRTRTDQRVVETVSTYTLTEANVQYRLEGTWIEKNSPIVSRVDAISRGAFGIVTISTRGAQEGGVPTSGGGGGGTDGGGGNGGGGGGGT
ncbi:MAG: hypothetical protein NZ740_05635 [Kiritimatiellae bacterium]|nr:hypothetical protein [Kiritimatiellia bacterium]MDW8458575.1 hypothetical protein [Verrucomicrobiota bacterium]